MTAPTTAGRDDAAPTRVDLIDAALPQTQCTKCGYQGCRPYAQAIADGAAGINRCPPGGAAGITVLARLTGLPVAPLDPSCGAERARTVAWIDESLCIGCTLCIQACPVDAIVGAARLMHTVVTPLCTGCDLCVAPCPVDCIRMLPAPAPAEWTRVQADAARARFRARTERLEALAAARRERLGRQAAQARGTAADPDGDARRALIQAAMERARMRQGNRRNVDGLPETVLARIREVDARRAALKAASNPQQAGEDT